MNLVMERQQRLCQTCSKLHPETNRLRRSETHYTIIILVWKQISEAVCEEVDVVLSGLVLSQSFDGALEL